VDELNRLSIFPSLFPMHTFYWGDWHREHTLGPLLSDHISPTGWVLKRGMRFSSHHDAPVTFPDSMRVLDATVTRRSRSGDILGSEHRVDVITALKSMTIWPAWQHFEENTKGSLEVGKLGDFVILSRDPSSGDPETIDTIKIMQTIKEGVEVYTRDENTSANAGSFESGTETAFARFLRQAAHPIQPDGSTYAGLHGNGCSCALLSNLTQAIATGVPQ
jgi:hypothetical protein